jgi:hypothetical protein
MTIHEYRPTAKPQQSKPLRSWRSSTTGIVLPMDPERLVKDLDGYAIETLRQMISDMDADLQKLRADRSSLMRSMTAAGSKRYKVASEVARIDLARAPMVRAWQAINREIKSRKDAPQWSVLFVKVARKRLTPELMELLSTETTQLRDAAMKP